MTLPLDFTRCLGEGSAGRICIHRQHCRRYLDRKRDGNGKPLSFAMMLCVDGGYRYLIKANDA